MLVSGRASSGIRVKVRVKTSSGVRVRAKTRATERIIYKTCTRSTVSQTERRKTRSRRSALQNQQWWTMVNNDKQWWTLLLNPLLLNPLLSNRFLLEFYLNHYSVVNLFIEFLVFVDSSPLLTWPRHPGLDRGPRTHSSAVACPTRSCAAPWHTWWRP